MQSGLEVGRYAGLDRLETIWALLYFFTEKRHTRTRRRTNSTITGKGRVQLRMHQKPFVGRALRGSSGGAHSASIGGGALKMREWKMQER